MLLLPQSDISGNESWIATHYHDIVLFGTIHCVWNHELWSFMLCLLSRFTDFICYLWSCLPQFVKNVRQLWQELLTLNGLKWSIFRHGLQSSASLVIKGGMIGNNTIFNREKTHLQIWRWKMVLYYLNELLMVTIECARHSMVFKLT